MNWVATHREAISGQTPSPGGPQRSNLSPRILFCSAQLCTLLCSAGGAIFIMAPTSSSSQGHSPHFQFRCLGMEDGGWTWTMRAGATWPHSLQHPLHVPPLPSLHL